MNTRTRRGNIAIFFCIIFFKVRWLLAIKLLNFLTIWGKSLDGVKAK